MPSSTKPEKSGFISVRRTLYGLPGIVAKTQKRPSSIQMDASYWFFFRRWNSQPPFSGSFVLKRYVSSILTLTLMT